MRYSLVRQKRLFYTGVLYAAIAASIILVIVTAILYHLFIAVGVGAIMALATLYPVVMNNRTASRFECAKNGIFITSLSGHLIIVPWADILSYSVGGTTSTLNRRNGSPVWFDLTVDEERELIDILRRYSKAQIIN